MAEMQKPKPRIVVVGAGVSGLTSALELAKTGKYDVAIIAKHMPGDYDIEYASPWAGANYLPVSAKGTPEEKYDRDTWPVFEHLAREVVEAGLHFQPTRILNRHKDAGTAIGMWMKEMMATGGPWFSEIIPNFRQLSPQEAAPYDGGLEFTSVVMNVALYLPWLASQCLKYGVKIRRGILSHLLEAKAAHPSGQPADLIVNAVGLAAAKLPGVMDAQVYPARAQIVIVRNEPEVMITATNTDDDDGEADGAANGDEVVYVMQRPAGGGTVLGGCYQKHNWDPEVDPELSKRIMRRAVKACPSLTDAKSMPKDEKWKADQGVDSLSVIRDYVGLRPVRDGGVRLEIERMRSSSSSVPDINPGINSDITEDGGKESGLEETLVIHNYGHGGFGYQSSYGCAFKVVELAGQVL